MSREAGTAPVPCPLSGGHAADPDDPRSDQIVSRVLLVGKGAPERGGIPTFLDTLLGSRLADEHELHFLNVAHEGTPQGGRATLANVRRTLRDIAAVWGAARGLDIVHIHSALSPAGTRVRAGPPGPARGARGGGGGVHAHRGG